MGPKEFLFVGGPLHAQRRKVRPMLGIVSVDGNADPITDVYPATHTDLQTAESYTLRVVGHVPTADQSRMWRLGVYVWQACSPEDAQMLLGDAVMHQYFVEYGDETATQQAPSNGKSALIVPRQ